MPDFESARQENVEDANTSPLTTYRVRVGEGWIDYNGHMNEGYYGVAFGDATDAYLVQRGFDEAYRRGIGGTFYTVETHIRFLRELKFGDPLLFRTTVLGVDAKKLHLFHSMVHEDAGYEAATQEVFLLHVSLDDVAVTPMAPVLLAAIDHDRDAHRDLYPEGAGTSIQSLRPDR
jgi:acyl-CoA thioesterase FadM